MIASVACAVGPKCNQVLNWFFLPKPGFLGIYFNFQWQKSFKNQYLPHSESKYKQINSIRSCSSRSFQQHQRHIPILQKFLVKKSFNIQELLQHKSKPHETKPHALLLIESFPKTPRTQSEAFHKAKPHEAKPMHSSLSRAFQRHQEHNLKHPSSVHLITSKQNKLPSFTDRCDLCDKHNPFSLYQFRFESCSQSSTHIKTNNDNTKSGPSTWLLFLPWKSLKKGSE